MLPHLASGSITARDDGKRRRDFCPNQPVRMVRNSFSFRIVTRAGPCPANGFVFALTDGACRGRSSTGPLPAILEVGLFLHFRIALRERARNPRRDLLRLTSMRRVPLFSSIIWLRFVNSRSARRSASGFVFALLWFDRPFLETRTAPEDAAVPHHSISARPTMPPPPAAPSISNARRTSHCRAPH
jgi:hypothetical protein